MIYVFLAHGFEEIEGITIVDILRRAQLPVQTVGIGSKSVSGAHDIIIECDITDEEVSLTDLEMIVLPGGMPGTLNLEKNPMVQVALDHAIAHNLWVGAICAAPSILGHRGLLDGKQATVFPGFESQLTGARLSDRAVVQDGTIITANGPAAALEFSLLLLENLLGKEKAKGIADSMQWSEK